MKWILGLVGALLTLVVVAGIAVMLVPRERIAQIATDQLSRTTGRAVQITGDVGLSLWPSVGVRADGLQIENAPWAAQEPMLQTAGVEIGVDAARLLRGEIRVTELRVDRPTIRIEQRADGRTNWQFAKATAAETATAPEVSQAPATRPAFSIARLAITEATLIYAAEGRYAVQYGGVDLRVDWPEADGAALIDATLRPTATPVAASATIARFAEFLDGAVQPVDIRLESNAGTLALAGNADIAGSVSAQLNIQTGDTNAFLRALGFGGVDLPAHLGRSLAARTDLTVTGDRRLSLRDMSVDLAGKRVVGAADITFEDIPRITAQLDVGALDLRSADESDAGEGSGDISRGSATGANAGWPTTPIDASGLAAFNGDITLSAQSLALAQFRTGAIRAVLRNENARLAMDLREVKAYGGTVTGTVNIDARTGLSIGGNLAARGIGIQPLLTEAIDLDRLTGAADLDMTFLGTGRSVDALMRSLSGDGRLGIGRGTLEGINLDRLMRAGDTSGGTTVFDSLTGTWTISDGVLRNDDLLVSLLSFEARGAGQVGLGARTVDYRITPVALRTDSGRGVALPIVFDGPWSNVRIRPDVEAALEFRLDAEKDKFEQRAKETIQEKLGIPVEDGQSVEDAIKDGLLKLFE